MGILFSWTDDSIILPMKRSKNICDGNLVKARTLNPTQIIDTIDCVCSATFRLHKNIKITTIMSCTVHTHHTQTYLYDRNTTTTQIIIITIIIDILQRESEMDDEHTKFVYNIGVISWVI